MNDKNETIAFTEMINSLLIRKKANSDEIEWWLIRLFENVGNFTRVKESQKIIGRLKRENKKIDELLSEYNKKIVDMQRNGS